MLDLFLINISYIWFVIAFLCVITELFTPGLFYFLSSSIAALIVGLIVIFFNPGITVQLLLFCVISIINFLLLKQYTEKTLYAKKDHYIPHLSKLMGKQAIVIAEINQNISGQIIIHNEIWMAYSVKNQKILCGTKVQILEISGAHLIVQPFVED